MLSKRPAEAHVDSFQKRARLSDPADEVASDFKDSLSDLSNNDRYQISTLTIIAKENTEHARAISNVLRTHIKTVGRPPDTQCAVSRLTPVPGPPSEEAASSVRA